MKLLLDGQADAEKPRSSRAVAVTAGAEVCPPLRAASAPGPRPGDQNREPSVQPRNEAGAVTSECPLPPTQLGGALG